MKGRDAIFEEQRWIQIWGIPDHWISKEVGRKIGKLFSHCMNVIIPENRSRHDMLIKLLVEVDIGKSLLGGTKLKLGEELV